MSKKWKDSILSSGIPLEFSVRKALKDSGIQDIKEYFYECENKEGIKETFSIDSYGKYKPPGARNLHVEYFVEVKYAHDSKSWVFMPKEMPSKPHIDELYIILDSLVEGAKFNKRLCLPDSMNHLFCEIGIVVEDNGRHDRYEINRGTQQLRYALVNHTVETLKKQLFGLDFDRKTVLALVPILVTTAKLWRIKPDVTIESIRSAKDDNLSEIAEEKEYIFLFEQPDNQMSRYNLTLIDNMIREELDGELTQLLQNVIPKLANKDFHNFVDKFHKDMPRYFLVTNYNYFEKGMRNSLTFFEGKNLINVNSKKRS